MLWNEKEIVPDSYETQRIKEGKMKIDDKSNYMKYNVLYKNVLYKNNLWYRNILYIIFLVEILSLL